jgi:transposase
MWTAVESDIISRVTTINSLAPLSAQVQAVADGRDDCDMEPRARLEDSLNASDTGRERARVLAPFAYGIGIDCHSRFIQVCVRYALSSEGEHEREFPTSWAGLLDARRWAVHQLAHHCGEFREDEPLRYTIESTGCYHLPVLRAWGGVPSVVNPLLAAPTRRKTDVLDARLLAYHSITGLWPASFVASEALQTLRVLWNERVEGRRVAVRCSNRLNNVMLRFGHTYGASCKLMDSHGRAIAEDLIAGRRPRVPGVCPDGLSDEVKSVIAGLIKNFDAAVEHAESFQREAIRWIKSRSWPTQQGECDGAKLLELLQTVPGIGEITSVVWLCEVGDPRRFAHSIQSRWVHIADQTRR